MEDPSSPENETPEDDELPAKVPEYSDDDPNLVKVFIKTEEGKKFLKELAGDVRSRFDEDKENSKDYREQVAKDMKLLVGKTQEKGGPWKDSAAGHVPSMLENMTRIGARIESELRADGRNLFEVMPTSAEDKEFARLLTLHGNWQIREKMPDFYRQLSKGIMAFLVVGDVTFHSYWDEETRTNRHEVLTPDDFFTPYAQTTTAPDYGDLPHYTKVLRRYRHQLEAMEDTWYGVDDVIEKIPAWGDGPDKPVRDQRSEDEGITEATDSKSAPYTLLWHEGWYTLPRQKRQRWCKVIQDYSTDTILSLTIHEEPNWQEVARFDRQQAELESYRQQLQMVLEAQVASVAAADQAGQHAAMAAMGQMDPNAAMQMQMQADQMHAAIPPEPLPPKWVKGDPLDPLLTPEPPRMDPVRMFSHGVCIEPLNGNLGISLGRVQADLNEAQDTMLNQFIDSGTLANAGVLLTTPHIELPKDAEISPGSIIPVTGALPGGLEQNVMQLKFPPANPQLMDLINLFGQWASQSAQSPGVLSGEAGKSGETYRGLATRRDEAVKQLSVPAKHFADVVRQVLVNNARLNAAFLDDDEIVYVLENELGEAEQIQVSREMYRRNYRVSITADMRFASQQQRIQEADELVQAPNVVPALQQNWAYQYWAFVGALKARGQTHMIQYLGAAPEPPQTFAPPPPMMPGMPPGGPGGPPGGPPPGPPHAPPPPPGIPGPGGQMGGGEQ